MRPNIRFFFFSFLFSIIATMAGFSQESLVAKAPKTAIKGNTFKISYTINIDIDTRVTPEISNIKDFQILIGPTASRSTSTSVISGVKSETSSTTYSYFFQVNKTGDFSIPTLTLNTKNAIYRSNHELITILPNLNSSSTPTTTAAKSNKTSSADRTTNSSTVSSTKNNNDNTLPADNKPSKDLFIQLELSDSVISIGDSIIVAVMLYNSDFHILRFGKMSYPSFKGFKVKNLTDDTEKIQQKQINGKKYSASVLQRYMLYPQKSGQLTITEGNYVLSVESDIKKKETDFFGDWDVTTSIDKKLKSQAITITVNAGTSNNTTADTTASNVNKAESNQPVNSTIYKGDNTFTNISKKLKQTNNDTQSLLFFGIFILLAIFIVSYWLKLNKDAAAKDAAKANNQPVTTKVSFITHLFFIAIIVCLIASIIIIIV